MFQAKHDLIDRRYVLARQIGKGGMGAVYEAEDRLTGEKVALKLVTTPPSELHFASRSGGLDLYLALAQEFKTLASLRHPNIISVLSYGFDEYQRPYFTMDLLENASSPARATFGKDDAAKVGVLVQICQALSYLHRRDIIHRDLKPANVRVVGDSVKVLDFGLAVIQREHEVEEDRIVGTLEYMAPELLRQGAPSVSSDLYAVGVLGYELFTGQYLFDSDDIRELARQIFQKEADPSAIGNYRVADVLLKLLSKKAEDRYQSAEETIAALCAAVDQPIPSESIAIRESFLQAASLVGREKELDQLVQTLDSAKAGLGGAWLVGGESGVGKSRLLEELRSRALVSGFRVLRGEAMAQGRRPYQVWAEIIRHLVLSSEIGRAEAGLLSAIVPDIERLTGLKPIEPDDSDPQEAQKRFIALIEKMVRQQTAPLLLVVEDVHWAGAESLALLARLAMAARGLPLLLVASYRDDEAPDLPDMFPNLATLRLNRLNENQIEALAVAMIGAKGHSEALTSFLYNQTEGNVFFLVEIVRALAEDAGDLSGVATAKLPMNILTGGLDKIIQRRLSRVPAELRPLLEVAAVHGRYLDVAVLQRIFRDPELPNLLTMCANAAVLEVQDNIWRFSHEKLRDGVLKNLNAEGRAAIHGEVAAAIEHIYDYAPDTFASLAYHWGAAHELEKEAHYASKAGEGLLQGGGYDEAARYLQRAIDLLPQQLDKEALKRAATLMRKLGLAYSGLGQNLKAREVLEHSLGMYREAGYPWGEAEGLRDLGDMSYRMQDYQEAYSFYRECIETARRARAKQIELDGAIGLAQLMVVAKRYDWAIELAAFISQDEVVKSHQTADRAHQILSHVETLVPSDSLQAALSRGREKSLSQIVSELL